MIAAIEVEHFQSIEHARLELGEWTSLVGTSDVGKSAIVRALHCLLTNARGEHFVRHGSKYARVTVELASGAAVTWEKYRGKSGRYLVGDEVYEKTAGEVPAAVSALLPVFTEVAGEAFAPGFQKQHDPPFLFAETPRRRAQLLGEFDGSNILLLADGAVRREQAGRQRDLKRVREDVERLRAELAEYEWVDDAQRLYEAAQGAQDASLTVRSRRDRAEALLIAWEAAADGYVVLDERLLVWQRMLGAEGQRLSALSDLEGQHRAVGAVIERWVTLPAELPEVPDWSVAERALERWVRLATLELNWAAASELAGDAETALRVARADLVRLDEALHALVGTVCAECGQVIGEEVAV